MEERVRICEACGAVVGWFAQFCEACGVRQKGGAREADGAASGRMSRSAAGAAVIGAKQRAEPEVRSMAKELFRAQLRLMHRTSEHVERLLSDISDVLTEIPKCRRVRRPAERSERLAVLSERLLHAEQSWEELQRSYNRESESAEEEWQENAEGAQMDAYLTPGEEEAIGGEFTALHRKFEATEDSLRRAGRELAVARRESESRVFGRPAGSPGVLLSAATAAGVLLAVGFWWILRADVDVWIALTAWTPCVLAAALLGLVAARR